MLKPNLFIIGKSGVGKTSLAKDICSNMNLKHIQASSWIRSKFDDNVSREVLTDASKVILNQDPFACINYIKAQNISNGDCVIEGLRNPFDFCNLFRPNIDFVIFINGPEINKTYDMDHGVHLIESIIYYIQNININSGGYLNISYTEVNGENKQISHPKEIDIVAYLVTGSFKQMVNVGSTWYMAKYFQRISQDIEPQSAHVHKEIDSFDVEVADSILFDDKTKTTFTKGKVIGISSYPNSVPTFTVLLNTGAVFQYIPPHKIRTKETNSFFELKDLVYNNCPKAEFSYHVNRNLKNLPAKVFFKSKNEYRDAKYIGTIDWYTDNISLNIMILDSGEVCFIPNHKILFNGEEYFPPYKKLREEFVI